MPGTFFFFLNLFLTTSLFVNETCLKSQVSIFCCQNSHRFPWHQSPALEWLCPAWSSLGFTWFFMRGPLKEFEV